MNWTIWGFHSEQRQKIILQNVQTVCGAHPPWVMEVIASSSRMMKARSRPLVYRTEVNRWNYVCSSFMGAAV